jgi:hypothetical protein
MPSISGRRCRHRRHRPCNWGGTTLHLQTRPPSTLLETVASLRPPESSWVALLVVATLPATSQTTTRRKWPGRVVVTRTMVPGTNDHSRRSLRTTGGNVENEVEFVTAVIGRGKEPRGDALHLIQRLLDVLLQHEVQHQPWLPYNMRNVCYHVTLQKKLLVNITMISTMRNFSCIFNLTVRSYCWSRHTG